MVALPRVNINTDLSDGLCFGCGRNNPIGLKLDFRREGNGVRADFIPDKRYQGWPGMVHGGIIGCLLDEAMSYAGHFAGLSCVTARMEVRWRRLVALSESLVITSFITRRTRKLVNTVATVCVADGTVVAEGTATHFVVNEGVGSPGAESSCDAGK